MEKTNIPSIGVRIIQRFCLILHHCLLAHHEKDIDNYTLGNSICCPIGRSGHIPRHF